MGEVNGYRVTILVMGTVYILTCLIHFWISKDCSETGVSGENQKEDRMKASEVIQILLVEPRLFLTLVIDLTSNVASLVLPSLAVYYYKYCAAQPGMVSTHMLIIGFGGLAGASLVRLLGNRVKNAKSVLLVLYVLVAASLLSIQIWSNSVFYFLGIGAVVSILTGMTSPFELTLYIDTAEHYRRKTGNDATGFIMGLSNLPVKFASIIKSTLIPMALMLSGYVANAEPTPQIRQAIVNAYSLLPAVFPVLGFILLAFFYKTENPAAAEQG